MSVKPVSFDPFAYREVAGPGQNVRFEFMNSVHLYSLTLQGDCNPGNVEVKFFQPASFSNATGDTPNAISIFTGNPGTAGWLMNPYTFQGPAIMPLPSCLVKGAVIEVIVTSNSSNNIEIFLTTRP